MNKQEKVIKCLELCRKLTNSCEGCPYENVPPVENCMLTMHDDALALLKEQEAVTIRKTKEHGFGVYGGICPKCRNWIQSAHSFCGFCGQAVKWG